MSQAESFSCNSRMGGCLPQREEGRSVPPKPPLVSLLSGYWSSLCLSETCLTAAHFMFQTKTLETATGSSPALHVAFISHLKNTDTPFTPQKPGHQKKVSHYLPSADCLLIALWVSSMEMDYSSLVPWRVMEPLSSVLLAKAHLPADSTKPVLSKSSSGKLVYRTFSLKVWQEVQVLAKNSDICLKFILKLQKASPFQPAQ